MGENALKLPSLDLLRGKAPQENRKNLWECGTFCILLLLAACLALGLWGANVLEENAALKEAEEEVWDSMFKYMLLFTVFVGCSFLLYWQRTGTLTEEKLMAILFLTALVARLVYTLEIGITTNQHDTSWFGKEGNNYGHTGYIKYIMENGIPNFDVIGKSQFYHPPLHHTICAWFLTIQGDLGIAFETAIENLQILTLFYSMVTLYAAYRILKLFEFKGIALFLPMTVLAFHPTFYLFSGSINNDCLSVMFVFLAVWAALEWHKSPSFPTIALLGLCIGCAMFSKLATGVVAPAVAFLFLHKLATEKDWKGRGTLIAQFALFGVICIPLGIGWQVRNYLLYDTPLTYVPKLSTKADQYLGGYSVAERFFDWDSLKDFGVYPMRGGVQGAEYFEHCIPLAVLKMSLFGEYSKWKNYHIYDASSNLLFWMNVIIVLATLVGAAYCLWQVFSRKTEEEFKDTMGFGRIPCLFVLFYWATMLITYIPFCFSYPHFCSMDYRYLVPTLLTGAIFLAVLLKRMEKEDVTTPKGKLFSALRGVLIAATALFAVCATMIYPMYY